MHFQTCAHNVMDALATNTALLDCSEADDSLFTYQIRTTSAFLSDQGITHICVAKSCTLVQISETNPIRPTNIVTRTDPR